MIVDGKQIAEDIYTTLLVRRESIKRSIKLGIIVGVDDPVIESFLRIKSRASQRLDVEIVRVDVINADTDKVIDELRKLSEVTDGIIVQLPLSENVDTDAVLATIPPEKDVDANGPHHHPSIFAPVAHAVGEILERSHVELQEKKILIVGHGRLVGKPVEKWFQKQLIRTTVVTDSTNLKREASDAGIIILGVGEPGLLIPSMVKNGVVIIDAGTAELGKKVVGDADPSCAEKASVFTPVPGGVGPIAVAMIFKNLFELVAKK